VIEHDEHTWASYSHAYGPATDIPSLLEDARHAPADRAFGSAPWHELWSALCHQESIYPASFRALPELVNIATSSSGVKQSEALLLAAAIEVCSHDAQAPSVPPELQLSVATARRDALTLLRATSPPVSPLQARIHAIATAAFGGDLATARSLLDQDDGALPMGPA